MRADRNRRLDGVTAERLIAGDPVGPDHLVDLLAWAAGPAHADELVGEEAATLAFRSARIHANPTPRRHRATRRWGRLVTVKAAALGIAIAAGGVALAAGTGMLPVPGHTPQPAPSTVSTSDNWFGRTGGPGQSSSADPSSAVFGLCQAYLAQNPPFDSGTDGIETEVPKPKQSKDVKKAVRHLDDDLSNPAFTILVNAADGADRVTEYCVELVNRPEPGSGTGNSPPPVQPTTTPVHPTGPANPPSNQPPVTNQPPVPVRPSPTVHPTGPPASP